MELLATQRIDQTTPAQLVSLNIVFSNVVSVLLGLAAIVLFVMLLMGGFKILTSAGDPKAYEAAKQTVTQAIIGIIVVASAYLILRIVAEFTGVNILTNFSIWGTP